MPPVLRFTSCQAPVAERFCAGVADYVGHRLGIAVEFIDGIPWPERLRQFDAGQIHVCWMCGLPCVWRADGPDASMELLGALVASGRRYGDQPVYFSDVLVRRDSPWSSFAEREGHDLGLQRAELTLRLRPVASPAHASGRADPKAPE